MIPRRTIILVTFLGAFGVEHSALGDPEPPPRDPPPNPAAGESYDGRAHPSTPAQKALWVPRVVLFPLRLAWWGAEPAAKSGVELEQRHHLSQHLYSAITSDDGQVGVRPIFSWVSSFRPSGGVHFFHDRLLGRGTKADFDISGGVDVFDVKLHLRPTRLGRRVQVFFDTGYNRRNDWLFTGIGSHAPLPLGASARYRQDRFDEAVRVDLHANRFLAFSLGGFFGARRFGTGESYDDAVPIGYAYCLRYQGVCLGVDPALVPGFNNGTQFLRASAGVHLDLRDDLIRPTFGALVNVEADYSRGIGSDQSSYFHVRGEVGFAISLWRHSHVLILRGATAAVFPVEDSIVPFSELVTLGGPNDLRGFRVQEFRGYSSMFGTAEYRWPVVKWVEAAVFADYGGVFGRNYENIGASQMQPDVGFGFRLHTRDRFFVRLQVAYGFDGGWQVYIAGQNLP